MVMRIPLVDLTWQYRELKPQLDAAIARVLASGNYILGDEVESFEREFAEYAGARYCIGVGNGQDAIKLALMAMGLMPGDEVILPANTCTPTWLGVAASGAVPVPVDPDETSMNVDARGLEEAITQRTKAVVPVHLYGAPVDMAAIAGLAEKYDLKLLQDCAQAHGASCRRKPLGGFGDAAAWSFYPTKNLGALGDGGAVTTNNLDTANRLRALRNGVQDSGFERPLACNSRLDELQAAVLRAKLPYLDAWNERRAKIAGLYLEHLGSTDVTLPGTSRRTNPCWHMFVIRTPLRDRLKQHLSAHGIESHIRYMGLPYLEPAFANRDFSRENFPKSERIRHQVLSLPVGPHLDPEHGYQVIEAIKAFARIIGNDICFENTR